MLGNVMNITETWDTSPWTPPAGSDAIIKATKGCGEGTHSTRSYTKTVKLKLTANGSRF